MKVKSCGAIVVKDGKYLVVKHVEANSGHAEFPKGHMDEGETEEETAIREVLEETGVKISLVAGFKEMYSYTITPGMEKEVVLFLAQAVSIGDKMQDPNIEKFEWLGFKEAYNALTYEQAKAILLKAHSFLKI